MPSLRSGDDQLDWYDESGSTDQPLIAVPTIGEMGNSWPDGLEVAIYSPPAVPMTDRIKSSVLEFINKMASLPQSPGVRVFLTDENNHHPELLFNSNRPKKDLEEIGPYNVVIRISQYHIAPTYINSVFHEYSRRNLGDLTHVTAKKVLLVASDMERGLPHREAVPLDLAVDNDAGLALARNPWTFFNEWPDISQRPEKTIGLSRYVYNPPRLVSCAMVKLRQSGGKELAVIDISVARVVRLESGVLLMEPGLDDTFLAESIRKCSYNSIAALFGVYVDPDLRSSEGEAQVLERLNLLNRD